MKITVRQKFHVGVLVVAAGAFVVDRCFFTPAAASARHPLPSASAPTPTSPRASAGNVAHDHPDDLIDLSGVAARLQKAAGPTQSGPVNDAFAPSAAWLARSAKPQQPAISPTARFRAHHRLMAVMTSQRAAWAIVDGTTLGVGQSFDGFRLSAVGEQSATFDSADGPVELRLPMGR